MTTLMARWNDSRNLPPRFLASTFVLNLAWEVAHLPLYTVWTTGSLAELAHDVLHCTIGDVLIATTSLILAIIVVGRRWPSADAARVLAVTVVLGLAYTVFSEWLNVHVRSGWAYNAHMPVVPGLGTGLTPLLQWCILPPLALWLTLRRQPWRDATTVAAITGR